MSRLSEKELVEILGPPESESVTRVDARALEEGVPRHLVKTTEWTGWPDDDDDEDENIRLIDLGEAFTRENMPAELAQPGGLQAPETIFTDKFDYRLDLWRAGLIVRIPPWNSSAALPNMCLRSTILPLESYHFNGSELIAWSHQ
jgi:serine/threonine-protein kinase SRPK3